MMMSEMTDFLILNVIIIFRKKWIRKIRQKKPQKSIFSLIKIIASSVNEMRWNCGDGTKKSL